MILKLKVSIDFLVTDNRDFCTKMGIPAKFHTFKTENRSVLVYDAYGDKSIEYLDSTYISGNIQVMSLKVKRVTVTMKNIAENLIEDNVILSYEVIKER